MSNDNVKVAITCADGKVETVESHAVYGCAVTEVSEGRDHGIAWFLNFFFQDLDHLIAEKCGLNHSARYVDDMVLFDNSKKRLHAAIRTVGEYLQSMQMKLKGNWQVFHLRIRPLDFLGFKFHTSGKVTLRKSILYRISRKARTIARNGYASVTNASGMISYKGYMDHSDSTGFYEKWIQPFINFKVLKGVVSNENRKQCKAICAA